MNYVLENKATGLARELRQGTPTANIRDLPVSVEQVDLSRADFVINATGEEALGHLLTGTTCLHVELLRGEAQVKLAALTTD
jgi:hypothetical protein